MLEIETFYQRNHGNFWVAIYDGKVVGTVALLYIGNHQVALRKMFVKRISRKRVGRITSVAPNSNFVG